jgi:hypothetical protein
MRNKSGANMLAKNLREAFGDGNLIRNGEYQRYSNAWSTKEQSSLIYAMIEGYPIGEMIRSRINESYVYEIVDGLQRITAITDFMNDQISMNSEDSKKVLMNYYDDFSESIKKRFLKGTVKLKFKSLPESLKQKIQNTEIAVATLSNWKQNEVVEYFRLVQGGKKLTHADVSWTVMNDLTARLKDVCNKPKYLSALNLTFEHGGNKRNAERTVYQTALEAMYSKLGMNIGVTSKLSDFFSHIQVEDKHLQMVEKIDAFLSCLEPTDRHIFNKSKSVKSNLKLMFCLLLHGDFKGEIKDWKNFAVSLIGASSNIRTYNKRTNKTNQDEMYKVLTEVDFMSYYIKNVDDIKNFCGLASGGHSNELVKKRCLDISDIWNKSQVELVTELV